MSDSTDAMLIAVELVKEFEGFSATPYLCPAGVPTIGYGSIAYQDGRRVTLDDPELTEKDALELMQHELTGCMAAALKASPTLATKPDELGAITDFVYNLGAGRYRASTLRKRIDADDWDGAKTEIMRWTRAGGKVLRGLVRRRAAEAAYFR